MWVRLAGITGCYSISLILRAKGKASREREALLNTLLPALRASKHPLVMDCLAGSLRVQSPTACPCLVTPGWSLPNGATLGVVRTSSQNSSFQSFTVNPEVQGQNIWALGLHLHCKWSKQLISCDSSICAETSKCQYCQEREKFMIKLWLYSFLIISAQRQHSKAFLRDSALDFPATSLR